MAYVLLVIKKYEKYLLQLRDDKKGIACPNCWGLFGGSVEENETPLESAIREMEEELGIKLKKEKFKFLLKIILKGQDFSVFLVNLKNNLSNLKLNEGQKMGLFSMEQIRKLTNITPSLIEILNKY